ncbi:unnamed protein product [Trichobilharzia regenti]|nr:unnamed protein product [Trichobilharzia regenti]
MKQFIKVNMSDYNTNLGNFIPTHHKNVVPDVPYSPNSSLVRLSKAKPKPGYAGHIWQIANLIDSAMNNSNNGSRGEFVKSIFEGMPVFFVFCLCVCSKSWTVLLILCFFCLCLCVSE